MTIDWTIIAALAVFAGAGMFLIVSRPLGALSACCFLLLIAGTRFRNRDPYALVTEGGDAQILFQLAIYGVILLIAMRSFLLLRPSSIEISPTEALLGSYVFLALISAFWSENFNLSVIRAVQLGIIYFFSFVAVRMLGAAGLLRVLTFSVVAHVLLFSTLVLLLPGLAAGGHMAGIMPRWSWFGEHPLMVATYAGSGLVLLLALTLFASPKEGSRTRAKLMWLGIVLLGCILLATLSRAAIAAAAMAVSVLIGRRYLVGLSALRNPVPLAVALVSCALLVGIIGNQLLVWGTPDSWLSTMVLRGGTEEQLRTLNSRSYIWEIVVSLFVQRPILGHGYLASRFAFLEHFSWAGDGHFALAESLVNLGALGTILIFLPLIHLLVFGFLRMLKGNDAVVKYRVAVASCSVFILVGSLSTPGFAGPPGYEVLLFFTLCMVHSRLGVPGQLRAPSTHTTGSQLVPVLVGAHSRG
jgi:exopolysaccharide production protein ExoQ